MLSVNELRAKYNLDVLKEDEVEILDELSAAIEIAAFSDKNHIRYDVSEEGIFTQYFSPGARVRSRLDNLGYSLELARGEESLPGQEKFYVVIGFLGDLLKVSK